MMNALLLTDFHGQFGKLDAFLRLEPELVIISGDLTNFGPVAPVLSMLAQIDVPCFAVPGNCDPREIIDALEESNAVSLHGSSILVGKISFLGLGGSNPTPSSCPFEMQEEEIGSLLTNLLQRRERSMHNVLVAHAPPHGTVDVVNGEHVGSTALRQHLKDFDLVCCGHVHEDRRVCDIDGVKVVNPGPAKDGYGAMIQFGDEPKDIDVELISV
ncbi:MAG: metallophosphoesterase [Methanomicrobiales archaeon]|nr:metallophosphoesterase [Methanomicrobiales archaeon]